MGVKFESASSMITLLQLLKLTRTGSGVGAAKAFCNRKVYDGTDSRPL